MDRTNFSYVAAAMHGDATLCKLLLARGADRNHRDHKGKTALEYAKEERHSELAGLLSGSDRETAPASPRLGTTPPARR